MEPNPNTSTDSSPAQVEVAAPGTAPQAAPAPKPRSRWLRYLPAIIAGAAVGTFTYLGLQGRSQRNAFGKLVDDYANRKVWPDNIETDSKAAKVIEAAFHPDTVSVNSQNSVPPRTPDLSKASDETKEAAGRLAELQKKWWGKAVDNVHARAGRVGDRMGDFGLAGAAPSAVKNTVGAVKDLILPVAAMIVVPISNILLTGTRGGLFRQLTAKQKAELKTTQDSLHKSFANDLFKDNKKEVSGTLPLDKSTAYTNVAFAAGAGILTTAVVGIISQRLSASLSRPAPRLQMDAPGGQFANRLAPRGASYAEFRDRELAAAATQGYSPN